MQGDDFHFDYEQEEKVTVPPMSHVRAKITTYLMKTNQGYTLKFSLPSNLYLFVIYKTRCQRLCRYLLCCCCRKPKRDLISAAEFCASMPNFREEGGMVSFTQEGTLSWVTKRYTIDKQVQPL